MQSLHRDSGLNIDDVCLIREALNDLKGGLEAGCLEWTCIQSAGLSSKEVMVDLALLLDSCLCLKPHALVQKIHACTCILRKASA